MNFTSLDFGTVILLLVIGTIIGAAISKILSKGPSNEELQNKLNETQDKFDTYQDEVSDHFQQTAHLVNKMTESYREVHEHLSKGAQSLAINPDIGLSKDKENLIGFNSLSGDDQTQEPALTGNEFLESEANNEDLANQDSEDLENGEEFDDADVPTLETPADNEELPKN